MNFDQDTEDGARNRLIGFSFLGLVAAGVVIGLLVGGLGLAAVRTADIGTDDETTSEPPSEPADEPSETESSTEPTDEPDDRPTRDPDRPVLQASPQQVATFEEIDLVGRLPEVGAGVTLQVQRRLDGTWTQFVDVTADTSERGEFSTFVQTGQVGRNVFRLFDPTSGAATPSAVVQVG